MIKTSSAGPRSWNFDSGQLKQGYHPDVECGTVLWSVSPAEQPGLFEDKRIRSMHKASSFIRIHRIIRVLAKLTRSVHQCY
ncbi:Complement component C6 [Frankliniella fusca]|uniref:Complement component C6 n=1 Tax=Frankliniella fusca TaxID=407009 RepID=A0AAE1GY23_9NEOP|nr:Complement component C6 [Frankliniella fusca]